MRDELLDTIPIRGNVEVAEPISDAQRIPGSENIVEATRRGDAAPIPKVGGGFSRITATGGAAVPHVITDEDGHTIAEYRDALRDMDSSHNKQLDEMQEAHDAALNDLREEFNGKMADMAAALNDDDDDEHGEAAAEAAAAAKAKADKKPDKK